MSVILLRDRLVLKACLLLALLGLMISLPVNVTGFAKGLPAQTIVTPGPDLPTIIQEDPATLIRQVFIKKMADAGLPTDPRQVVMILDVNILNPYAVIGYFIADPSQLPDTFSPQIALAFFNGKTWEASTRELDRENFNILLDKFPSSLLPGDTKIISAYYPARDGLQVAATYSGHYLPWQNGVAHTVTQRPGGCGSHCVGSFGEFAWDFSMANGAEVWATRIGTVKLVQENNSVGTFSWNTSWGMYCTPSNTPPNYVVIYHDSGASLYLHLKQYSVPDAVVANAPIGQGDVVGGAGNVGYVCSSTNSSTSGTHLHYQVQSQSASYWAQSGSVDFAEWDEQGSSPTSGNQRSGGGGTNNPPAGYTKCADENGRCAFSGTADVVYGALNSFTSPRSFSDGVDCNNSVFGDPISGTGKSCYYKSTGGGSSDSWSSSFYDTIDRWNDNNNSGNYRCSETISSTFLDQNYGTGTRCGMDPDTWVGEYSGSRNFGAGNYVFYVEHDDGLKLWINGSNKADRSGSGSTYVCPAIYLNGSTPLKVMLREDGGDARVKVSWSTDTSPCNAPGSFGKSGPGNGAGSVSTSPTLSWNSSSGASEYKYCIDTTNNANCDSGWQSTGSSTSVALGGLSSATTYYWQVLSTNSRIETVADGGTWWSFSTQPVYAAQFVSQSVPTSMLTGRTYSVSVTFRNNGSETWTAASYYNLGSQNPTDNSTWGTSRAILPAAAAIAPGQNATYSFNVVAPVSAGNYNFQWRMVRDYITWFGDSSTNQAVTVSAAPTIPATPGGLTASDGTDYATIQLSWNAASGASYYEIFRSSANSLPANPHKTGLTGLSLNDTLLLDNVKYYYWVRACNANGCSPVSAAESGSLKVNIGDDIALPLTPILVQATSLSLSTLEATQGIFDPLLTSCNRGQGYATIWLRISTPTARWLVVDTIGSDYDTMLAVWSGTPGNLQPVGTCNDDLGGGSYQSRVAVPLAAGGSYYVEVSQFQSAPGAPSNDLSKPAVFAASGGALRLNIRWASSLLVKSAGAYDGFVIESSETSSQGGIPDSTSAVFKLGDTATRRQLRAILAFNTAALPDNAVILSATLKIRQASLPLGSNPFGVLGPILVDARTGPFGLLGLTQTDFQAAATLGKVASFAVRPSLVGQWYSAPLLGAGLPTLNKTGWSEFRLAYRLDDNNDALNNQLSFNSGTTPDLAPQLVITYYVP
jgi:hypothetical protein